MTMQIEGKGEVPNLEIGFYHAHHADCVLAEKSGDWESLKVKIGEIARLMLGDNQPVTIPPDPVSTNTRTLSSLSSSSRTSTISSRI